MKIYLTSTDKGIELGEKYLEDLKPFVKSERCLFLERIPEKYVNGGGEKYGWGECNYADRIKKGFDSFEKMVGGSAKKEKMLYW